MKACCLFLILVCVAGAQSLPIPGQAPPAAGAAQENLSPDTVVAKVDGGKDVTVAQVQDLLRNEGPQVIERFLQDPSGILGRLLMVRELVAEGEKEKIADKSPLKEQLEQMRMQAIATGMINYMSNSYRVSIDDVKAFYNSNPSRYQQAKIKAILVEFKPSGALAPGANLSTEQLARMAVEAAHTTTQRTEEDAKSRALEVVRKLREGGDFAKLAGEYSDDAVSQAAGGDFAVVTQTSSYPDEIKKAVFNLKPGDISDPIRENSGFYIIQLVEKSQQPVEQLIEPITEEIRQNHVNEWFAQMTARFQPSIQNQEFFLHPERVVGLPSASPANGTKPGALPGSK